MNKAILLTIRLWYFYLTYKGVKTEEIRKSCPKDFIGDVYEYVSKTNWKKDLMKIPEEEREFFKRFIGKVGLKFTLKKVVKYPYVSDKYYELIGSCLSEKELIDYSTIKYENGVRYVKTLYAWHIDNLVIFDKPKELSEFKKYGVFGWDLGAGKEWQKYRGVLTKSPQSYMFIESEN